MDIRSVPNQYRPIPFWSWNDELNAEETRRQVRLMHKAGIGGFFMHARGGLRTEYMGEEWFNNISAGIDEAQKHQMYAWAYDENGWPSGFGNGIVNGMGEYYQQKYLRMADQPDHESHVIAYVDGKCFYYEVNPFYVDTLDPAVTEQFINTVYVPYYEKYGTSLTGFFTDEPQISRKGIPWSLTLEKVYRECYQEELIPHLPELFLQQGEYKQTRIRFWKLITDLFSEHFMKKIFNWCEAHGLQLTGHLVCEETFLTQMTCNGACMPHYEYFSIPGMDCLGRNIIYDLTSYQLGSAAQQLGKKQVLSETFALCGHNVSFDELRAIYSHQMIHGINLLCQHLQGYTIRGIRKRDYPPAMYYQQPWWEQYEKFCTAMSRIGMILAEGQIQCDVLLIHPQTTAWTMFDGKDTNVELEAYYERFKSVVNDFDARHIPFHLGDETLMERHGCVQGNKLIVGKMAYSTVVVPENAILLENTRHLLAEFKNNGGTIVTPEEVPAQSDVVENPFILYTKRSHAEGDYYYLLNHSKAFQKATIKKGRAIIDQYTGEKRTFSGEYEFAPYESILLLEDGSANCTADTNRPVLLDLSGEWTVEKATPNVLTLDRCNYYFDGMLVEEEGYVLNIQNRALKLERPVFIRQEYRVLADFVPNELFLVCETPEKFRILVNNQEVSNKSCGWFVDSSFKKIDISGKLHKGVNQISFEILFTQPQEVYDCLRKAAVFETEKNKLTYDIEIEPCYLIGNFGVRMDGSTEELERNAFRFRGDFRLCKLPEKITLQQIEKQGFLFFAGALTLTKEVSVADTHYQIAARKTGINAVDVQINNVSAGTLLYYGDRLDCSKLLHPGTNTVRLQLRNTLRNMLGPHHLVEGESYTVGPSSFFKENCVWNTWRLGEWHEDYSFVHMNIVSE